MEQVLPSASLQPLQIRNVPEDQGDNERETDQDGTKDEESDNAAPKPGQKRPGSQTFKEPSRLKRLRPYYSDAYRQLYNEEVEDVIFRNQARADNGAGTQQHKCSLWSATELDTLFDCLARSQLSFENIQTLLPRKSVPEVESYIQSLEEGLNNLNPRDRSCRSRDEAYFEPAAELSARCVSALESTADSLNVLQFQQERLHEQHSQGRFWLLTGDVGRWVERCLEDNTEDSIAQLRTHLPSAELLHLNTFLDISKRLFMNSSNLAKNYQTYAESISTPSIMHSAFADFHAIVVHLTRRIVQCALSNASIRIRGPHSEGKKPHVMQRDVHAAIAMLNLPFDGNDIWINSARKHELKVYERVYRDQPSENEYTLAEVERILSEAALMSKRCKMPPAGSTATVAEDQEGLNPSNIVHSRQHSDESESEIQTDDRDRCIQKSNGATSSSSELEDGSDEDVNDTRSDNLSRDVEHTLGPSITERVTGESSSYESEEESDSPDEEEDHVNRSDSEVDDDDDDDDDDDSDANDTGADADLLRKAMAVESKYLEYLEQYDHQQSRKEERRMWRIARRDPDVEMADDPRIGETGGIAETKGRTRHDHRRIDGLDRDWRRHTQYRPEWQSFRTPVPEEAFARNRAQFRPR